MNAEDSRQTVSHELQHENRQVRLVYKRSKSGRKPPIPATFGGARRSFQVPILARDVVAATGDRACGLPAQAAGKPCGGVARTAPYRIPLILRISNRGDLSFLLCRSPNSALQNHTATPSHAQTGRRPAGTTCHFIPVQRVQNHTQGSLSASQPP
jgi:hypothetical protein